MSRSGYSDDCDDNSCWLWMGAVARALKGKRGQAALREIKAALEAMTVRRLITDELECDGEVCTLGALGRARGVDMDDVDPDDRSDVAYVFGIAESMAAEIMFENDEGGPWKETPEERWQRMHRWVTRKIVEQPGTPGERP